jgi:DNA (cytosine-5)-methyltransferase 1
MKYGSVCSGVEAASMAWEPIGWEPVFFSEIEEFPSEVLKTHWPEVPNHGDMEKFDEWGYQRGSIDVLVGGTPCQSFSIAGLRGGLSDSRGNLALTYCRMVDQLRPRWTVWENVPGVLSSGGGRDFGSIVGALAELGYSCSWRVLDAQNFGVPQRRRRVFLVGHSSGDWRYPASVLFESKSGTRDFEASRKAQEENPRGSIKCFAGNVESNLAATLQTTMHDYSRADGFNTVVYESHPSDSRTKELGDACSTVTARWGTGGGNTPFVLHANHVAPTITSSGPPYSRTGNQHSEVDALVVQSAVRRLTPTEAERLQGFPDGHTDIGWKGKATPDSHRYKAMGNSMAVPVMRWIGERIQGVEDGRLLHRDVA